MFIIDYATLLQPAWMLLLSAMTSLIDADHGLVERLFCCEASFEFPALGGFVDASEHSEVEVA